MAIRKNGVMVKCPDCGSINIVVVEINMRGEKRKCMDCNKMFESPDSKKWIKY